MSALRNPANDLDAIEEGWIPLGVAATHAIQALEPVRARAQAARRDLVKADIPAMAAVEGWRDFPVTLRDLG